MAVDNYQEFNNFQSAFYNSIAKFESFTNFEFKRNGYRLFNNLSKGFPNLIELLGNTRGFGWKAVESPAIMKALQKRFIGKNPQFIYYKNFKEPKVKEPKVKETKFGLLFDNELKTQICTILLIDSKTYEYLKYSDTIQKLGLQLNGEFVQKEKLKVPRKKKI